ncbi:glycosyltransferase [Belliella kenyensis]|uniref:Glycosyltransferase n=1 Tax=Belliella kenyensis TaxID=1472724 RepID=A0ABV8EFQ0_9BACT|nr:glycosyltransferase [Belliella kenyensis]MCH7401807.1 glycosyltransferase [Belliella kenyensis]MDN3604307.1 glycosyltransferase [Belliella kenyensis]
MQKKLKILHIIKSLGRGGAEKLIAETSRIHNREIFEIHCIYFHQRPNHVIEELNSCGVHVTYFQAGNFGLVNQVKRVKKFIKSQEIDLIHAHLPWAGILARLAGNRNGIPIIYTEHNVWHRYNKLTYLLNRLTYGMQDLVIAVSDEVAHAIKPFESLFFKNKNPKIITLQNAVDTTFFTKNIELGNQIKNSLSIPNTAFVVGNVAVFRKQKRLDIWIKEATKIWKKLPNTHFILVGDGPLLPVIQSMVNESPAAKNFHLVGIQHDVLPYLSAMDLFMISSAFEGLPIAMLEAMSCNIPIVSCQAGGIGEVVEPGKEGFLCTVENHDKLSTLCLQALQDPSTLVLMGKNARKKVQENFSLDKFVSQLETIYQSTVQSTKKTAEE